MGDHHDGLRVDYVGARHDHDRGRDDDEYGRHVNHDRRYDHDRRSHDNRGDDIHYVPPLDHRHDAATDERTDDDFYAAILDEFKRPVLDLDDPACLIFYIRAPAAGRIDVLDVTVDG